jgi:septal ring factor EnvC (AmiA/AmiB activator)
MTDGQWGLIISALAILVTAYGAWLGRRGKQDELAEKRGETIDEQEERIRTYLDATNKELTRENISVKARSSELEKLNRNLEISNEELVRQNNLQKSELDTIRAERVEWSVEKRVLNAKVSELEGKVFSLQSDLIELQREARNRQPDKGAGAN